MIWDNALKGDTYKWLFGGTPKNKGVLYFLNFNMVNYMIKRKI